MEVSKSFDERILAMVTMVWSLGLQTGSVPSCSIGTADMERLTINLKLPPHA